MGVAVEAFREVSHAHSQSDFNFAPCRSIQAAVDATIFDMPQHMYYAEASSSTGYGVEAPVELRDFSKGVISVGGEAFCEPITDAPALSDGGDEVIDWVSPRISFSHDLFIDDSAASRTCRTFPEKRAWLAGVENGDFSDGYSSEFEFLSKGALNGTVSAQTAETMISADELISEGKLIPMARVLMMASSGCEFDACRNTLSSLDLAQTEEINVENDCMISNKYLSSVHLAQTEELKVEKECMLNNKHLSSLHLTPTEESTVEKECILNSKLSMQETDADDPSAGIATLPASSALPKAGFKYTSKIKEFFRPKRIGTPAFPHLTRDHSTSSSSTCRIPVPARSFWPFTRSNSAGESKAASSIIPKRSFSAGDADTSRLSKNSEQEVILELDKHSCMPDGQGALFPASEQDECNSPGPLAAVNTAKSCTNIQTSSDVTETSKQVIVQGKGIVCSHKVKLSGSPGRAACKRYSRMTSNFLRGSPGRGGGMSSLAKTNGSRIVLWNLERCSTEKLCRETSGRRAVAYPVVMRISPVINVAIYRGKVPSPGTFGLRSLFSSKKEKVKEKNADINNWRAGA